MAAFSQTVLIATSVIITNREIVRELVHDGVYKMSEEAKH